MPEDVQARHHADGGHQDGGCPDPAHGNQRARFPAQVEHVSGGGPAQYGGAEAADRPGNRPKHAVSSSSIAAMSRLFAPRVFRMAASYTRLNLVIETAPARIRLPLRSTSAPIALTAGEMVSTIP